MVFLRRHSIVHLLLLSTTATVATLATPAQAHVYPSVLDNNNQVTTKILLQNISEWILTTDLPTNNLTKTSDKLKTSIFINGNLARTLLAASKIFNNNAYLSTGLSWCDTLVTLQTDQLTSQGRDGGWWDTGYSELYIADTGTAVTCLALCYDLATDNARKQQYMTAMLKFSEFVVNGTQSTPVCTFSPGCHYDSLGNNTETTNTWVLKDGSLGDGYYMHHLNLPSYTISTATTGGCFFAEMYALTGREDFKTMASQATAWLLEHVQANGTIPYFIYPPTTIPHEYQCTSYSAEAIIDVDLRGLLDPSVINVTKTAQRMIEYLLKNQQANGELINPNIASIGEQQRSPRAVSILQWYYQKTADNRAKEAINKYVNFLETKQAFDPTNYGVNSYALVTGFVGIALADLIQPWSTFSRGL